MVTARCPDERRSRSRSGGEGRPGRPPTPPCSSSRRNPPSSPDRLWPWTAVARPCPRCTRHPRDDASNARHRDDHLRSNGMPELVGTASDDCPEILAVGRTDVSIIYTSLSKKHPD